MAIFIPGLLSTASADAVPGGKVSKVVMESTALTAQTYNPEFINGTNVHLIGNNWTDAVLFITADAEFATNTLTIVAEASVDGVNWAPIYREIEDATGNDYDEFAASRVLTGDVTEYMVLPLPGKYVRFSATPDANTVTATLELVLR